MTTFASALRLHAVVERSDARLDGAVAVRRCAQYRKAFRWAAVSYPADVLSLDAPSAWIRRHGVSIDVGDGDELERALSAGVDPLRVITHQSGPQAAPVRDVVDAGVGRVVVATIAAMQRIAKQHGVIPARLSLADVDVANWGRHAVDLNAISDAIGDAVEAGCIGARFGRPAVNVSPSAAALVPGCQPAR